MYSSMLIHYVTASTAFMKPCFIFSFVEPPPNLNLTCGAYSRTSFYCWWPKPETHYNEDFNATYQNAYDLSDRYAAFMYGCQIACPLKTDYDGKIKSLLKFMLNKCNAAILLFQEVHKTSNNVNKRINDTGPLVKSLVWYHKWGDTFLLYPYPIHWLRLVKFVTWQ